MLKEAAFQSRCAGILAPIFIRSVRTECHAAVSRTYPTWILDALEFRSILLRSVIVGSVLFCSVPLYFVPFRTVLIFHRS